MFGSRQQLHVPFESPLPARLRWIPTALAIIAVCIPVVVASQRQATTGGTTGAMITASVLVAAVLVTALLLRARYPRSMAATAIATTCVVVLLSHLSLVGPGPIVACVLAVMVTVFGVGSRQGRTPAFILAIIAVATIGITVLLARPDGSRGVESLITLVALVGLAATGGIAQYNGRAFIQAITDRARRAEETRESEAERRVAEERLAIARDLHDVMAHQIAVINLHAASASQALRTRPDDAERSLTTVREAARTVLGEIGGLLTVLRSADGDHAGSLAPTPGLAHLPQLIDDFSKAGLSVEQRTVGTPIELDSLSDIVAHRVLQEGLTNAHKHGGDGTALVQLDYGTEDLAITVTNVTRPRRDDRIVVESGHGLVGVRERVSSVGGNLETSFGPGPVHRFVVTIPIDSSHPRAHS
ncbi:Signal transduction histidine kinase [Agreia pratensis]|uniref:histidine kinase n=1 Tax=Agreia pratensis TaxID=150121 RepID=A0A1X7K347_9MICO|nr:Signal transduction histidine kinase [Agreia pratensis]